MPSIKIARLQQLILQRVAIVLSREIADPRLNLVTITRVELTNDLEHCKVFWSTLEEDGARRAVERGLDMARGYIQREVARSMHTRVTPVLTFVFDQSIEGAEELARILREAQLEDRANMIARGEIPDDEGEEDADTESKSPSPP
jgi:ribosome-binding factor A